MTKSLEFWKEKVREKIDNSQSLGMYDDILIEYEWNDRDEMLEFFASQDEESLGDWCEAILARSEDENCSLQEAADLIASEPENWDWVFETLNYSTDN